MCIYMCVCVCVCVCIMEYNSTIKKYELMSFAATWKDLEIIILNEVIQEEKDKYHLTSLIYGIEKKKDTNQLIYKTERLTDIGNKFKVTKGELWEKDKSGV